MSRINTNRKRTRPRGVEAVPRQPGARAARKSDQHYRLLFELNPCPMWICEEKTLEMLDVNAAALQLYGWSRQAFLQLAARDIRPPEDVPKFLREVHKHRKSRVNFAGEWRHRKRDGSTFDVAVTLSSIRYAGRAALLVLANEITARKQTEEKLKQLNTTLERHIAERTAALTDANERLHAIMDTALVGILTLDNRGRIETLNPAAVKIFGCEPQEAIGQNISRMMACPDQKQGEGFLAHCLEGNGRPFSLSQREVLGRPRDGKGTVLELSLAEFTQGGRRQFAAMVRNITARKRLERELLETTERERRQLGHEVHDGLGQHLHALFYLATLHAKRLKEESPSHAREAGRLVRLLDRALELTRGLARGLQPVAAAPEGLMIALRELARSVRSVYQVDCRYECHPTAPIHKHSVANHLYRIAQEAVNNAVKHGRCTRIRITLAAGEQRITLSVQDNGIGLRRRTGRGQGMGLHVMQYRADAINGSLFIQPHPQGGTEVVCTVPSQGLLLREDPAK